MTRKMIYVDEALGSLSSLGDCAAPIAGAEPAPINPVMPDQAVGDFHNLRYDLIAVGRCTRIFPNEHSLAIGEPFLRACQRTSALDRRRGLPRKRPDSSSRATFAGTAIEMPAPAGSRGSRQARKGRAALGVLDFARSSIPGETRSQSARNARRMAVDDRSLNRLQMFEGSMACYTLAGDASRHGPNMPASAKTLLIQREDAP